MLHFAVINVLLSLAPGFMAHDASHTMSNPLGKIDTHSHFVPPFWREESVKYGFGMPDGMPGIPPWSEEAHLEMMRKANITKSILSITSPGTNLVPHNEMHSRSLTRRCNEFAADLKQRRPDKFGFWASLPLPDVEGSLAEVEYAFDALNADGVAVLTSAHGVYLGDPVLEPVFEALNKRNATIFVHPTSPCIKHGNTTRPASPLTQYPNPMFEFFFDTARAVVNLFTTGAMEKLPGVTFILSHAGGALPPLVARFTGFATSILGTSVDISAESVKRTLNSQFYFDLAGFAFPDQIKGLLPYVNASRITYGSDYPYTPEAGALDLAEVMNEEIPHVFKGCEDMEAIYRGNAMRILGGRTGV